MAFNDIIGHDIIKIELKNAIEREKLAHAHILVGEDGIGKSLIAQNAALKILNKDVYKEYVDLIEWRIPKNKKTIGVKEIRELVEEINKESFEGKNKVIIIYQAHKMTIQAQNAFLKTIEEPPKGIYIFLLCENSELILDTIKSRCQIYNLKTLTNKEIREFLNIKYTNLSEEEINVLSSFSNGIPGRAEKFLGDDKFKNIRNKTLEIMKDCTNMDKQEFLKYSDFLSKYKDEWEEVLNTLLYYIRDCIIFKEVENVDLIINIDKINEIKELSNLFSLKALNNIVDIINETRERLERNLNSSLVFEMMLLKFQEV